jgi:hypothetical protein
MEVDNRAREYKYQKDWSIGTTMFHVRCDDWADFCEALENMESILPKTKAFPDDTGNTATPPQAVTPGIPECGIHHVPMTWRGGGISKKTGKPYNGFWSCPQRNPDNSYCSFKPQI